MTGRVRRAHLLALLAALATVVVMTALWIVNLRMGPPLEGFTGGPMLISMPLFLLLVVGVWLVVRAMLGGRFRWHALLVVIVAAAFALAPVILYCGPVACFAPGPNRLLGWFVVVGAALTALVHHLVYEATSGEGRNVA
jgi:hypothetical protein